MQIKWKEQQSTILGFGLILLVLGIFSYVIWTTGKDSMNEMVIEETPIGEAPETEVSTPIGDEKSKVRIYTKESKLDENGDNFDVKVLRAIDEGEPELLTTIELRDVPGSTGLPYNINLSPDKKSLLIYSVSGLNRYTLQLLNLETREIQNVFRSNSALSVSPGIFSPDSKEIFFLQSENQTYDFYLYNIADNKSVMVKTVKPGADIFDKRWLPDNQILLTYSLETTRENPSFKQEFYIFNKDNQTISASTNQKFSLLSEGNQDIFNSDNTLFAKPKTFTTKTFKPCFGDDIILPNSYSVLETLSGKEIASFKANPEEPITPISFSPDNKEILYRLDDSGCALSVDNSKVKYYIQSLDNNKQREEVNLDDIIEKWDIIFNVPSFGSREIIFYQ